MGAIVRYRELYGNYPLKVSLLNGLVAKEYKGKYQTEFNKILQNIKEDKNYRNFWKALKFKKRKLKTLT